MVEYSKPISNTSKCKQTIFKKDNKEMKVKKINSFRNFLKPKPKSELQQIYQQTYDEVYKKERTEYLKRKAEQDAKKNAKKAGGFIDLIIEMITGGRSRP